MNNHTYVAIMAGGIGSRFWPLSRTQYPKQFLDILGIGRTLIQATFDRFVQFIPLENIYVVTADEYISIVQEQLPQLPLSNILGEPSRNNTAPCIAYISFKLYERDNEAQLIVAPSDHLISNVENFIEVCDDALAFVQLRDAFVTLGIRPTYPNTGYGYLQYELPSLSGGAYKVKQFVEKPSIEKALLFIEKDDFLWNAGIFIWKAKDIIHAFKQYLPDIYILFEAQMSRLNTIAERDAMVDVYRSCPNVSIDKAIIEKADNVYVIPCSFGWSDLGTWNSAYETLEKDGNLNAINGTNALLIETENCLINVPKNKLIVVQGLENYIIVDTQDVILICNKEKEQEIKDYVGQVRAVRGERFV